MSDSKRDRGQQWLEQLLQLANISAEIVATEETSGYWLTLNPKGWIEADIERLIGDRGQTLDAIQYLANSTLNIGRSPEDQAAYTIELNGYRRARLQELQAQAEAAAREARETGSEVEMTSLSAAERRQVHTFLKENSDLETFSRGQEPHRHLVVRLR